MANLSRQDVASYRHGAEVLQNIKYKDILTLYLDKAYHLAAIHKADEELWQIVLSRSARGKPLVESFPQAVYLDLRERVGKTR